MGGIEMVVKRIILWCDVHYIPISQPFQADNKTSFAPRYEEDNAQVFLLLMRLPFPSAGFG